MNGDAELPQAGELIGVRYRIENLLGQGGMGAVFAATNEATGRAVAIKWMLPTAARSKEALGRFMAEARATAKIEHPNVIEILDVGSDRGCPFLVMERLRGESLGERLERGRMHPVETIDVLIAACRGVAEAHSEGVIHRDIKPDNIFLCRGKDGSPRPPKVLDFGISKLYDEETAGNLTKTGIAMGTPNYMSPEQLNAPKVADARFDVYAMGIVAYECLTGRLPYDAEGLFALVQQIAAGTPLPVRQWVPEIPPPLEAVVMQAMHARSEYRHQTMAQLVAALEQVRPIVVAQVPSAMPAAATPIPGASQHTPHPHTPSPAGGTWNPTSGYSSPGQSAAGVHPPTRGHERTGPNMVLVALVAGLLFFLAVAALGGIGAFFLLGRGTSSEPQPSNSGPEITDSQGASESSSGETTPTTTDTTRNSRRPQINLTFSGDCNPRFNRRLMVIGQAGNLIVNSTTAGGVTGQLMLSLPVSEGTIELSTQQANETQTAVMVVTGQRMWMNRSIDLVAIRRGRIADPITGRVVIREYDEVLGRSDLTFENVSLQNSSDGSMCRLSGTLRTTGTTYGN